MKIGVISHANGKVYLLPMPKLFDLLGDDAGREQLNRLRKPKPQPQPVRTSAPAVAPPERRVPDAPKPAPAVVPRMDLPDFVALDFETTGLDQRRDRITEIGAVVFVNGQPTRSFSHLVNPGIPIPPVITDLTGIKDADVAAAPPLSALMPRLLEFIGHLPICGHQIDFDIGFINEELKRSNAEKIFNQALDTALIARLLLPEMTAYNLGTVAAHLGITLTHAHRALDDARASGHVAVALLPKILDIPFDVRQTMAVFAPPSLFKKVLVRSLGIAGSAPAAKGRHFPPVPEELKPSKDPRPVATGIIATAFDTNGAIALVLPGFAPRKAQSDMAVAVGTAMNNGDLLVAEAGTGTGKTLAYLYPAALYALENNCRVLVSTHTRNLQDQLAGKDLPVIAGAVKKEFRFSVLKGRSNYLCRHRYQRLLSGELGNFSHRDRNGLLPLIRWAEQTATGDIEEQQQFNRKWYAKIWNLISADSHQCMGFRCPVGGDCFLKRARGFALASHVVVINHALFYSEVCAESSFLGEIGPVIFDEAHHLEETGHAILRTELDTHRVNLFLDFCNNLLTVLERRADERTAIAAKQVKKHAKHLRKCAQDLLDELDRWAATEHPAAGEYQAAYRDHPFRTLAAVNGFTVVLSEMQDAVGDLGQILVDAPDLFGHTDDLPAEVQTFATRCSQLKADLAYLTAAQTDDHVFWIEGNHEKGWVKLVGVPLDIGSVLGPLWARSRAAAVFTSATLSVAGEMGFFMRQVGLTKENSARTVTTTFASPFASSQTIRGAVARGPAPDDAAYPRFCADAIEALHAAFDRNILVLFTANTMLKAVETALKTSGTVARNSLMAQGPGSSRHALLEQFKRSRHAVLLGAASFWEGIDAPGETCELVVIPRLPFPVPTHPLKQALAESIEREQGESFYAYSLPEAVIKLRQGAGRLIRTTTDRGALIILDNRIITREYGSYFVKSLGGAFASFDSFGNMVEAVTNFFEAGPGAPTTVSYVPFDDL
jgi:ATP-dependent DNA helicase DinG